MLTREQVINALHGIFDPEIPVNIWDLGLIYDLTVDEHDNVAIVMTLTAMGCPVGPMIADQITQALQAIGAEEVTVTFTYSPPWTSQMLTPDGREQMQIMGFPV